MKKQKREMKAREYDFIGIRPVGDLRSRLDRIAAAARIKGEIRSFSAIINECAMAHLPVLEARYGVKPNGGTR